MLVGAGVDGLRVAQRAGLQLGALQRHVLVVADAARVHVERAVGLRHVMRRARVLGARRRGRERQPDAERDGDHAGHGGTPFDPWHIVQLVSPSF